MHAAKGMLIYNTGEVLERWALGLLVMIEKIPGCALITKIRSILLMKAYLNTTNKGNLWHPDARLGEEARLDSRGGI